MHAANLLTSESSASALFVAIGEDDLLGSLAVDTAEVAPDRWQVVVYLDDVPDLEAVGRLRHTAAAILGQEDAAWSIEPVAEADWVARSLAGLSAVRAGRFIVHGSHDSQARRPNEIGIEIDAGEAFGTGHHGTTAGCLMAIDRLVRSRPIRRAADIGTGSGVLAIAIAKCSKAPVVASDIDGKAAAIADANARINGVGGRIRAVRAEGLDRRLFLERGPFDLVVANILAAPLAGLAPAIRRRLAPTATIILSGLLPEQKARIVSAYRGQGLCLAGEIIFDGWLMLVFARGGRRRVGRTDGYKGKGARPASSRALRS